MLKKLAGIVISLVAGLAALYYADVLSLELRHDLLDTDSRRSTGAVALLALAFACAIGFVYILLRLMENWLWRSSSSISRIFTFFLFMAPAGLTSYYAWDQLRQKKPDSSLLPDSSLIIGLLVATLISLLIAVWGRDIVRRLRKVGTAGIEFGTWQEIARIPELAEPPRPTFEPESDPWGAQKLTDKQRWFYQLGSSLLFHLGHSGVKADELEGRDLDRYRRLVAWVGMAALNERAASKAFDILRRIENLRNLSYDELYFLGTAYLWVALDDKDLDSQTEKLDRSAALLERAVKTRPKQAPARWTLGYVYDELKMYPQSIEENEAAIKLDSKRFLPWASWTLAVTYLKLKDRDAALNALANIGPGSWWAEIQIDGELKELLGDPLFHSLVAAGLSN